MKRLIAAVAIFLVTGVMFLHGFGNKDTDAGYQGYVYQGAVFGQYRYAGIQTGKTSTGFMYSPNVINISTTPYASQEDFLDTKDKDKEDDQSVVAKDKLRVEFSAHVFWRVIDTRSFVEYWAEIHPDDIDKPDQIAEDTYNNILSPVVRAYIREEVEHYNGLDLGQHQGEIGTKVLTRLQDYVKVHHLPVEVTSVNVGTISPPQNVLDAIGQTQALGNKPAQLKQEIENHRAQAKARIQEAIGIQKSMRALNSQLVPEYLLYEMTKALASMKDTPNNQIIFMPRVPMTGTVPMPNQQPNQPPNQSKQ